MRRLIGLLFAFGLAVSASADAPAVCTTTPHSPGTSCSASSTSATTQIACSCAPVVSTGSSTAALQGFFTNFWKLADVSDSIGSVTLTQSGTPVTFSAGKIGNAGNFDATPRFLNNASVSFAGGGSATVACWFKTSSAAANIWVLSYGAGAIALQLYVNGGATGKVAFRTDNSHIITSTAATYNDGNWHLAVAYHDGASNVNTLIVDNGTPDTVAGGDDPSAGPAVFAIGNYSGTGLPFIGMIDACGIAAGKTPTAAQLTAMWNAGVGAEPPF